MSLIPAMHLAANALPVAQGTIKTSLNDYHVVMEPTPATESEKQKINTLQTIKITRPSDYSTEEDLKHQLARQASFWSQRFLNPGLFNSAGVDRLLFKNQNFIKFVRKDYLFNHGYFGNDREYHELMGNEIFDQGTTITVGITPISSMICRINSAFELDGETYYWVEYKSKECGSEIQLFNEIGQKASSAYNASKNAASSAYNASKNAASSAYNASKNAASSVYNASRRTASSAYDSIRRTHQDGGDGIEGADDKPKPLSLLKDGDPVDIKFGVDSKSQSCYKVFDYPIPKYMFKQKKSSTVIQSFFKLNEEQLLPFVNENFFNYLHMFKYSLKKSYAFGRINLVYHNIKALGLSLKQKQFYKDEEMNSPEIQAAMAEKKNIISDSDPNFYKNYLHAYRIFMTKDAQNMLSMLKFSIFGNETKAMTETLKKADAAAKVPEGEKEKVLESISSLSKEGQNEDEGPQLDSKPVSTLPRLPPPSTLNTLQPPSVSAKAPGLVTIGARQPVAGIAEPVAGTPQSGGKRTRNIRNKLRLKKNITKKLHGGLHFFDKRGVIIDKLAKYVYADNLKNKQPIPDILKYAEEEQRLFIGLALKYFDLKAKSMNDLQILDEVNNYDAKMNNSGIKGNIPFNNYIFESRDRERESIENYLNTRYNGKTVDELIDSLTNTVWPGSITQTGGLFGFKDRGIASKASSLASKTVSGMAYVASKTASGVSSATRSIGKAVSSIGEAAFPNNAKLNKIFDYSYKRMIYDRTQMLYPDLSSPTLEKDREQLLDFLKEISWCIMMSAHFTCSTALNFIGMISDAYNPLTYTPLASNPVMKMVGVQTPHCYMSGVIFLFLLYQIQPFSLDALRGIDEVDKLMKERESAEKNKPEVKAEDLEKPADEGTGVEGVPPTPSES